MSDSELKFEAPIAQIESDECLDFEEFQSADSSECEPVSRSSGQLTGWSRKSLPSDDGDSLKGSLEDLVSTFDEKVRACFNSFEEKTDELAPVQMVPKEEVIKENMLWTTLAENYTNVLPLDWPQSVSCMVHTNALNLKTRSRQDSTSSLESDDEELLRDQLDLHAIIVSTVPSEPIQTAEQVLHEIDEIIQDSAEATPDSGIADGHCDMLNFRSEPLFLRRDLETFSLSELNEILEQLENKIREYSENLIHELALRDELEFEKEVKNNFISLLLSIQNKRRQTHLDKKRSKRSPKPSPQEPPSYLTTVIPYHTQQLPPSLEQLQILIKVLHAINEDSPTVPELLTNYILKVVCPS